MIPVSTTNFGKRKQGYLFFDQNKYINKNTNANDKRKNKNNNTNENVKIINYINYFDQKKGSPFFFFQIFVVEAGIIHFVNIYISLSIMMIPASTTKIWKKKKGLPHFSAQINNIINIFIKLNFNGRIVDAAAV